MQPSHTQTKTTLLEQLTRVSLHSTLSAPREPANIPKKAGALVNSIRMNDLFTAEQKLFAEQWESLFHSCCFEDSHTRAADSLCFFYIRLIKPALLQVKTNRIAENQLLPVVALHLDLLIMILPKGTNPEEYLENCEKQYRLMTAAKAQLKLIAEIFQKMESEVYQEANQVNSHLQESLAKSLAVVEKVAADWKKNTGDLNQNLSQITDKIKALQLYFLNHSIKVESIGHRLTTEDKHFQQLVTDIKVALGKV